MQDRRRQLDVISVLSFPCAYGLTVQHKASRDWSVVTHARWAHFTLGALVTLETAGRRPVADHRARDNWQTTLRMVIEIEVD